MFVKNISKLDPVVCSCAVCCYSKRGTVNVCFIYLCSQPHTRKWPMVGLFFQGVENSKILFPFWVKLGAFAGTTQSGSHKSIEELLKILLWCLGFSSAVKAIAYLISLIWKRGGWGESWEVWHMAASRFLLDSPQRSDWQVFNGCITACIKKQQTHTCTNTKR